MAIDGHVQLAGQNTFRALCKHLGSKTGLALFDIRLNPVETQPCMRSHFGHSAAVNGHMGPSSRLNRISKTNEQERPTRAVRYDYGPKNASLLNL